MNSATFWMYRNRFQCEVVFWRKPLCQPLQLFENEYTTFIIHHCERDVKVVDYRVTPLDLPEKGYFLHKYSNNEMLKSEELHKCFIFLWEIKRNVIQGRQLTQRRNRQ